MLAAMSPGATLRDLSEREFLSTLLTELEQANHDDASRDKNSAVHGESEQQCVTVECQSATLNIN